MSSSLAGIEPTESLLVASCTNPLYSLLLADGNLPFWRYETDEADVDNINYNNHFLITFGNTGRFYSDKWY